MTFSQTSVMEGIPYTGVVRKRSSVEKLVGLLVNKIETNKHSACYVSKLRGGAEPSYDVSYSLNENNSLDITLIKPSKMVIGAAVLNKQVICFTPVDKLKVNTIDVKSDSAISISPESD